MRAPLFIATLSLLSACSLPDGSAKDYELSAVAANGQSQTRGVKVVPRTRTHEITFNQGDAISAESAAALSWLNEQGVQSVRLVSPLRDKQRAERELSIIRHLRGMGIPSTQIGTETVSELVPDTYLVTVYYTDATPPNCPNWSTDPGSNNTNLPFSQMGCATVSNLTAQTMNPEDLKRGTGTKRYDPTRSSTAMQAYTGASSTATSTATTSADSTDSAAAAPAAPAVQ